jgi:molecular chaperone DnaK (HSP70)
MAAAVGIDLGTTNSVIGATWPSAHPPCPAGQTRRWPSFAGTDLVGDREVAALEGPAAARGIPTG